MSYCALLFPNVLNEWHMGPTIIIEWYYTRLYLPEMIDLWLFSILYLSGLNIFGKKWCTYT